MHETVLPDTKNPPRPKRPPRRVKVACAKCKTTEAVEKIPEGWLTTWNAKTLRFVHRCPDCQGRRSRKKTAS